MNALECNVDGLERDRGAGTMLYLCQTLSCSHEQGRQAPCSPGAQILVGRYIWDWFREPGCPSRLFLVLQRKSKTKLQSNFLSLENQGSQKMNKKEQKILKKKVVDNSKGNPDFLVFLFFMSLKIFTAQRWKNYIFQNTNIKIAGQRNLNQVLRDLFSIVLPLRGRLGG